MQLLMTACVDDLGNPTGEIRDPKSL